MANNQQQQHQLQAQHQGGWNRGRSVPNLNPMSAMSPHNMHQRKPPTPNPQQYQNNAGMSPNSPGKYRRSTSYPGKSPNDMQSGGYNMEVAGINEDGPFMGYQVNYNKA